ncbi:class I SAM-dependent methyltransferase [hot springs metagenome]|uniref:Class I SAM-dependent methyltransferase n=1 Tax=hot springs metagenome TaxID=433727 RepID=A0A5J4L445_9ZZZZ
MQEIYSYICPICQGNTQLFFENVSNLLECKECGIVFDINASLDKAFYEDERASSIDGKKIKSRNRNVKQRVRLLKRFLKREYSLLDIGCGEGLFLKEAYKLVNDVKGIEPTKFYVEYAKNSLNLPVQQGFIEDFDFSQHPFDMVTMFHVLEHLYNPVQALKKVYSWLKPGGYLVIEVPNIKSRTALFKGSQWEMFTPEHKFYFSPTSLKYLLEMCNFQPVLMRSRDFDQYRIGIGKSLRKLGISIGKSKHKENISPNKKPNINLSKKQISPLRIVRKNIQLPIRALLGWLVMKLNRGDYIFVVSKKI